MRASSSTPLRSLVARATRQLQRSGVSSVRATFCTSAQIGKVTLCGSAGGIGQPLALQLKQLKAIRNLALYDVVPLNKGVAVDLSHVDTPTQVQGFVGDAQLHAALEGANIVVIPAGVPRKPGMTRDDLFNINAKIVATLTKAAAHACPDALLLIITNPVNSTVPIAATLRQRLNLSANKLMGVTMLDVIRTHVLVSQHQGVEVSSLHVPVICGHAGNTIVPVLSNVPNNTFTQSDKEKLTKKIAFAGDEVVAAKAGGGSATLSMAFAATKFLNSVIHAAQGASNVRECAYVSSSLVEGVPFFSSPVLLGADGFSDPQLPPLDEYEQGLVKAALPQLKAEIAKGVAFGEKFVL